MKLNEDTAYRAMIGFLEENNSTMNEDDIRDLLERMRLVGPKQTNDPGLWKDWMESISEAQEGRTDLPLDEDSAYAAMFFFLDKVFFSAESRPFGLGSLLGQMQLHAPRDTWDPATWGIWADAVKKVIGESDDA